MTYGNTLTFSALYVRVFEVRFSGPTQNTLQIVYIVQYDVADVIVMVCWCAGVGGPGGIASLWW